MTIPLVCFDLSIHDSSEDEITHAEEPAEATLAGPVPERHHWALRQARDRSASSKDHGRGEAEVTDPAARPAAVAPPARG